jgi:hypothetical protein
MAEGELRGFCRGMYELGRERGDFSWCRRVFRDEVATAELDGASGDGGRAVARNDDADEVGCVDSGDCH